MLSGDEKQDDSAGGFNESISLNIVEAEGVNVGEGLLTTELDGSSQDMRWTPSRGEPGGHASNTALTSAAVQNSGLDSSPSLINSPSGLSAPPIAPQVSSLLTQQQKQVQDFMSLSSKAQRRMAGLLRMHVVGSVRSHIEAGHLDFINEIRPLTCLFIGFPSLLDVSDTASHSDQLGGVQFVVQQVQEVMRR
jgi:hypothetical protein